jgi:hypothetical protein
VVVEAVSHALAPVHVGIFAQKRTLEALLRASSPGVWAQAAAVRDVIVYPTPPYVAVALGADAVRGVADVTRRFLGGIDFLSAVSPLSDLVRSRVSAIASVTEILGFDPLSALATWLRRGDSAARAPDDDGGRRL